MRQNARERRAILMTGSYIGFEGPIGAGKTTLATLLASHLRSKLILEEVDGNEFLADFYLDRTRWALPMQLWFLTARHSQLVSELQSNIVTVADYTFAKDGNSRAHASEGARPATLRSDCGWPQGPSTS